MHNGSWFSLLSFKQRMWLFATGTGMVLIVIAGVLLKASREPSAAIDVTIDMSIKQIAPELGVTNRALARELNLPIDISKQKPLRARLQVRSGPR